MVNDSRLDSSFGACYSEAMSGDRFLDWIKERRKALERELRDLDAAERTYLVSGIEQIKNQAALPLEPNRLNAQGQSKPLTIKEMVLEVLRTAPDYGMTSGEILSRINKIYDETVVRTSLSPQISRLRREGKIVGERPYWRLARLGCESV